MIKLPIFILTWIGFLLFRTVFIVVGLFLIPPMALLYNYTSGMETSKINGRFIRNWKYGFMYPWSNDEDGIIAGSELIGYPAFIRIIYWSAIRNPANNLRFVKGLNCIINPDDVEFECSLLKNIDEMYVAQESLYQYDEDRYRFVSLI